MDSSQRKGGGEVDEEVGFVMGMINEIISSPINMILVLAICFLFYKIFSGRKADDSSTPSGPPPLPKMKKQDFTLKQLKMYDGTHAEGQGRILIAVNGKVFDVTRGKRFYGPGGPYSSFAGHDASRALAMFATDLVKDEYDDLSDLNTMQMESIKEWEIQLSEKYDYVGRLLKPGEEPANYSDEEEGESEQSKKPDEKKGD